MTSARQTHYQVLEVGDDAKLIDIKKAYRRLALKHHPDRNGGSPESTERFKQISEAYTILSNPTTRSEYDVSLKCSSTTLSTSRSSKSHTRNQPRRGVSDPFQQFNELFRNDPFFHDAFQDMDDVFAQRFEQQNHSTNSNSSTEGGTSRFDNRDDSCTTEQHHKKNEDEEGDVGPINFCGMPLTPPSRNNGSSSSPKSERAHIAANGKNNNNHNWGQWIMNKLGIELEVTSYSQDANGGVHTSSYSSKPTGTYTNKSTRTFMENGRKVTVMSMEKDGNKIEDKFVGGDLVERKINGVLEDVPRVTAH